ncbi:hypothetical protein FM123_05275 [Limosilactobacillus fermentum]|uniref:DUF1304 domain-containing protein n=1 Tax=Limosilactobacillus fermentum TaxID=1613 RepID=UPI00097F2F11|nr:DUF1304 family protein [Limosilactobacillus fermentum]SJM44217.1 hypothetical protein FM122_00370 [Limosilactobacillus fermentum]SJM55762.1 hypothetical protein FM123_05275 [Limosilactobacillus fermentum]
MSVIVTVFATLVALEFLFIMYLETFRTTSAQTARVFAMTKEELARPSVNTLFKNQGIYNGLIGILLLVGLYLAPSTVMVVSLLVLIVVVAAYGSLTSSPSIIWRQGGLAIMTLLLMVGTLLW